MPANKQVGVVPSDIERRRLCKANVIGEKLTIKAAPLANGMVKAKTGDTTDATVYNDWYKAVYMPAAAESEAEGTV